MHQKTNSYTPEQNGLSERMNQTLVERAKCMLFNANLSKKFWGEAINTAAYLRNRTVCSGLGNKTPIEIWSGKKPDISHLRVFGSTAMVHVPKKKRQKRDKKSIKTILVGYSDVTKGYRLYNPSVSDVIVSRDIVVIEEDRESVQIKATCREGKS